MSTYFPGEDYLTYDSKALTYDRRARPARAIIGGITKFIDYKDFSPAYLDRKIKGWEEYVYIDEENKTAKITYADPLSSEQAGYWHFKDGTLDELLELSDKYSKIFVHITDSSRTFINMWKVAYHKRARWLYDIQNVYRDRLAIIPFGTFDYELYYCMGMAGGGRSASMFYEREIVFPDGRSYPPTRSGQTWGPWIKYRKQYPGVSNLALSFLMLKKTPILNKKFYENKPEFNAHMIASQLKPWDVCNFYFARNYRNLGKPNFVKSQNILRGTNALRPDQHRFLNGDGVLCDKCTLSYACKIYRKGGVCLVDGTEGSELVQLFKSDKAEDIVKGMQYILVEEVVILENELERRKSALASGDEEALEKVAKPAQISKMMNSVLSHGEKVAKLKDPSLTKPKVNITMPAIPGQQNNGKVIEGEIDNTPRLESMSDRDKADLIRRMEKLGYNRASISQQTMQEFLEAERKNTPALGSGDGDF